jgi:hypothetical protein
MQAPGERQEDPPQSSEHDDANNTMMQMTVDARIHTRRNAGAIVCNPVQIYPLPIMQCFWVMVQSGRGLGCAHRAMQLAHAEF